MSRSGLSDSETSQAIAKNIELLWENLSWTFKKDYRKLHNLCFSVMGGWSVFLWSVFLWYLRLPALKNSLLHSISSHGKAASLSNVKWSRWTENYSHPSVTCSAPFICAIQLGLVVKLLLHCLPGRPSRDGSRLRGQCHLPSRFTGSTCGTWLALGVLPSWWSSSPLAESQVN